MAPPNRATVYADILAKKVLKDTANANQEAAEEAYKASITAPPRLVR